MSEGQREPPRVKESRIVRNIHALNQEWRCNQRAAQGKDKEKGKGKDKGLGGC